LSLARCSRSPLSRTASKVESITNSFTLMKIFSPLKGVFALILFAFSFSTNVLAQCPDSTYPDPGPAWSSHIKYNVPIPGTTCHATVWYCDRYNPLENEWEMVITQIIPNSTDTCHDPGVIIGGVYIYFTDSIGVGDDVTLPDCSDTTATVTTYLLRCWSVSYDPITLDTTFTPCNLGGISCSKTCKECYDGVLHKVRITGCTSAAGYNPHFCAAPPPWPWPQGVCYDAVGHLCDPR
jgi:hypothetical protein